jgi:CRP-like cAMP-binding protein
MIVMAAIVGHIANIIESKFDENKEYNNTTDTMDLKLDSIAVSPALKRKVFKYLNHIKDKHYIRDHDKFSDLAISIQRDMLYYMNQSTILQVPFLRSLNSIEICEVMKKLKTWVYIPGDIIVRKGDMGNEMFFVIQGDVEVFIESKKRKAKYGPTNESYGDKGFSMSMGPGSYFGELALITNSRRTATVRARDFVVCDVLTKEDYNDLLIAFPSMKNKLRDGVNQMKNTKMDVIIETIKRVPLFNECTDDDLRLVISNYMELIFIDPKTLVVKPSHNINAFYILLRGQIKRYKSTRETIKYIKNLTSNQGSGLNGASGVSFNERISMAEDEEREYYVRELITLARGDTCGTLSNLTGKKTKKYKYFDVADSA